MTQPTIGILHPGAMGISVAASAQASGCTVYWVGNGRSPHTYARAQAHNLQDAGTLAHLCATCRIILSICPPHAAEQVASDVIANGFTGLFVDGNAIAPQRAQHIGQMVTTAGAAFVDGGIIGGPAWQVGETWLYLSGERADEVAACFVDGMLETAVIGPQIGKASALKMCYAAYTKGTTALLSAILATAEQLNVRTELENEWSRDGSDFASHTQNRVRRVTAKAWRFAGEMEEIAATFEQAGLPGGFHLAANEIYQRMAHFKDTADTPPLAAVLSSLRPTNHTTT
ncbi:MAG: NAD(P)-dependent oxidoreductase [Ardenticatenaceae bacterium]|nr:NAD(P)-dependent oxidoreductase [Ardenticatenaceae bacterium]